jgi:hypothetical protein
MKKNINTNLWKAASLFFAATSMSLLVFTAFKKDEAPQKPAAPQQSVNSTLIKDKEEAKALYSNFLRINAKFTQQGGFISKATLAGLLSRMTDSRDTAVFYYLGANTANQNVIMLFNDPTYSPILDSPKYKTIAPFCPPSCNKTLNDYLTQ